MLSRLKNQSFKKLMIMLWNILRMSWLRAKYLKHFQCSIIQNINPSTEISIDKGNLQLSHSVFTRRNVSFRVSGGDMKIGTCFFNQGCSVTCLKNITIGDNCLFGPNVVIVDHDHDYRYSTTERGSEYICKDIIIGNNVVVGANTVILKGSIIGDNCMIGAGSIVNGNVPEGMLYYTNHDKVIKSIFFK